ncbi:hypothetical protein [Agrobacterium tumefaciens]|uniref:hypothetical protein n=1 Tax=Agrobacterium tumefaciens TaxID=358 RepID=UPI000DE02BD6|nr:hypothetical protein [Agrobacterium tumefaciens]NTD88044.1 hypothetical protein [Agrobacterium tumefaciens]NTD88045.1 hypothetical protein [Agrobacterium tumefaciens]NTD92353.1 hypothetical protein [Agrobacterium tumefaciens]NTD92354.1 hypothetical protein [Agrobacterium tumefaciens]NTD99535.1 hypothetical protein [Agrobacterium tumefaciens]
MKYIVILSAFLIFLFSSFLYIFPIFGAVVCPSCFGFVEVEGGIYIDASLDADLEKDKILGNLDAARLLLKEVYVEVEAPLPTVFFCVSNNCATYLGTRGEKASSYGHWAIVVYRDGNSPVILAHELSHIEIGFRLGFFNMSSVPIWFDEGLAVVVSQDRRYLNVDPSGRLSCKEGVSGAVITDLDEWWRRASTGDVGVYSSAACEVIKWMNRRGNEGSLVRILDVLRSGESFDVAFQ